MAKRILTDKMLAALKPAKPGSRTEVWDADIHARGLGIRVTPAGTKTFILMRRFPGSPNRSGASWVGTARSHWPRRARRPATGSH